MAIERTLGSEVILNEYRRLENDNHFKVFPSLRFEYFLVLLRNTEFIIGNSSAGIRESGIYGVPAIDIGTRQSGRYSTSKNTNLQHVSEDVVEITDAIKNSSQFKTSSFVFGQGNSTRKFMNIVRQPEFWSTDIQKHFVDRDL